MNLKIESDFHESYDVWFDKQGDVVFRRFASGGPSRLEQFKLMEGVGLVVPPYGFIDHDKQPDTEKIVVYQDNLHCGEGKQLVESSEWKQFSKGLLYSHHIKSVPSASSYRYLRIGDQDFVLFYASNDSWRSNCGDVTILQLDNHWGFVKIPFIQVENIPYPMFAIDFVEDWESGIFYAVDFNISPGIKNTPTARYPGFQIVRWIKQWYEEREAA